MTQIWRRSDTSSRFPSRYSSDVIQIWQRSDTPSRSPFRYSSDVTQIWQRSDTSSRRPSLVQLNRPQTDFPDEDSVEVAYGSLPDSAEVVIPDFAQ